VGFADGRDRRAHHPGPSIKAVAKSVAKNAHTGIKIRSRQYVEKL